MARMNLSRRLSILFAAALLSAVDAGAAPRVGEPAPDFSGVDANGKTWALADQRGKVVILEWTNHQCPYVSKHYSTGNMQGLQKAARNRGFLWLSVISSAPGRQGHVTAADANRLTTERDAFPQAVLLDESGEIGRAYDASTTPQMFIIGADGVLLFMGGIDDRPTTNPDDVKTARNFVRAAMEDIAAGRGVAQAVTRPYGCSVKYD
jgi:peroxiredoxin